MALPLAQWRRDSSENPSRKDGQWAGMSKKVGEKESKRSFPFLIMTI